MSRRGRRAEPSTDGAGPVESGAVSRRRGRGRARGRRGRRRRRWSGRTGSPRGRPAGTRTPSGMLGPRHEGGGDREDERGDRHAVGQSEHATVAFPLPPHDVDAASARSPRRRARLVPGGTVFPIATTALHSPREPRTAGSLSIGPGEETGGGTYRAPAAFLRASCAAGPSGWLSVAGDAAGMFESVVLLEADVRRARVSASSWPVADRPSFDWKSRTAAEVRGPIRPSTGPGSKPFDRSACCAPRTSTAISAFSLSGVTAPCARVLGSGLGLVPALHLALARRALRAIGVGESCRPSRRLGPSLVAFCSRVSAFCSPFCSIFWAFCSALSWGSSAPSRGRPPRQNLGRARTLLSSSSSWA